MKIVINDNYGGFGLSCTDEMLKACGAKYPFEIKMEDRANPKLVEIVRRMIHSEYEYHGDLAIYEIPDESTDWIITDYDGAETLYYVLEGKIYVAMMEEEGQQ